MRFDSLKNKLEHMLAGLLRNIWLLEDKRALNDAKVKDAKINAAEMKRVIDAFPEPLNDYDRCYRQYQCVLWGRSKVKLFFMHCAGLAVTPFFLALYALNRLLLKPAAPHSAILINSDDKFGNVWDCRGLLPRELNEEFPDLKEVRERLYPPLLDGALGMEALKIWLGAALRHPLKGYSNFIILSHIMSVNRLLLLYRPKALIVLRAETTYASSLMTMLCERGGRELILLMHGELVVNKNTAFSRFSRMYIWDEHYRKIMLWGRSDATRYIVAKPDSLSLTIPHTPGCAYVYDICYYMSGNDLNYQENLEVIRDALAALSERGLRVKIRPHPRWSDARTIQMLFDGFHIEWAAEKTVADSIAETRLVLGMHSTILLQAFYAGKTIVLDDVSSPAYFSTLEELQYIMIKKPHLLLSDLLRRDERSQKGVPDEYTPA